MQLVSQKCSIAVARTGVLHSAIGLPVTRKTATEEDRGEDNKDPDWLIKQSIARQVAVVGWGGVRGATLRNAEKVDKSLRKEESSSTF